MSFEQSIFKCIINDFSLPIFLKDLEGKYLWCNSIYENELTSTKESILGKTDSDFLPAELVLKIRQNEILALSSKSLHISQEDFINAKNEEFLRTIYRSIFFDENNQIIGVLCVVMGKSERKINALLGHENENIELTLNSILANLPGHVYWKDINSVFLGCNDLQAKSAGFSKKEDLIGKTDYEMPWKNEADSLRELDLEVMRKKQTITREEISRLAGSDYHSVFLSKKSPLFDRQGDVIGILGISLDISDRKKAEKQLAEAIQAKSTFLSIVSHEIKGPLSNVIYILRMLREDIENNKFDKDQALGYITTEIADANRGIEIINYLHKFLNLSNPQPEKIITLNLRREFIRLIDRFEENNEKDLAFSLDTDDSISSMVRLNSNLFDVIEILLMNAVKYSKKSKKINVKIINQNKDSRDYLVISVEDQGVGIKEEVLNNLFTPLFGSSQLESYTAPAIKLSFTKKMMETLGGSLDINSKLGKGTIVTVVVPYEKSNQDVEIAPMPYVYEDPVKPFRQKLSFLVVEDNPVTSILLKEKLRELRHKVDTASTAMDAIKFFEVKNYDVIFMDISLPGINGVELINKLRSDNDKPIMIAITSHDSEKDIQYFVEQGFATVIGKPFLPKDIHRCIDIINQVFKDLAGE